MYKCAFLILAFVSLLLKLFAEPIFAEPGAESEEESLYLRRIYTLWEDKDYPFAKSQIEEFCQKFPNSPLKDRFTSMLGDIAFHEKNYEQALKFYAKVQDESIQKSSSPKKWHALYQLKRYNELQIEITDELMEKSEEAKFYYAESLFRQACAPALDAKKAQMLWSEALSLYGDLLESPIFSENAKIATAEIYRLLGEPKQAAKYYLELAEIFKNKDGIKQEEVLFHASIALKEYDTEKAIEIADHLAHFGTKRRKESAHLWFYLLVKTKRFDVLAANQELFLLHLQDEKKGLYHYFVGKHYLSNKEWAKASQHLEKCSEFHLAEPYEKEVLTNLIECAKGSGNLEALEKTRELFKTRFPDEIKTSCHIDLMLALTLHQRHENAKALAVLEEGIAQAGDHLNAYLLKAKILTEMQHIPEAALLQNIEEALSLPNMLCKEEQQKISLFLAEGYLSLKNTKKAIETLKPLARDNYEPSTVHFLLSCAYCNEKELERAIDHGEKALKLDNSSFDRKKLHLHLFNAYLEQAKVRPHEDLKENAAQHLYAASFDMPISLENRLWLANHFVKKCELSLAESEAKKAIATLEPLFGEDIDFTRFENQALMLLSVYEIAGAFDKEQTLITKLLSLSYNSEVSLKQGDLWASLNRTDEALSHYCSLENDPNPFVSSHARLKGARLFFAHLGSGSLNDEQIELAQDYLRKLKELKLRKTLKLEPVYLEAAIEYAENVSSLQKPSEREKVLLELLCRTKEEFLAQDDIASKDYHASFAAFPDQAHLFTAYMRYIDAKIYQLQAKVSRAHSDNTKQRAALALFSSLRDGKYAVTKYIKDKSEVAMR